MSIPQTDPGSGWLQRLAESTQLTQLLGSTVKACVMLGGLFLLFWVLEARAGADKRRYFSRHFFNDTVYALFYQGGFYGVFIFAGIRNALEPRLAFFELGVIEGLPAPADFVLYWIILDFLQYWIHRLQHTVPFLWSFHSVHHSQERMTFLTTFRNHPFEQVLVNVVMLVPVLVLGIPGQTWLLLYAAQMAFESAHHAELDWTWGRLYPVIVSPRFHAFHHAVDARYHHSNFGKLFSVWDYAFGTAASGQRPSKFGVDGLPMRETLLSQLLVPFRLAWRTLTKSEAERDVPPARVGSSFDTSASND